MSHLKRDLEMTLVGHLTAAKASAETNTGLGEIARLRSKS
jgi:hypothetical protein